VRSVDVGVRPIGSRSLLRARVHDTNQSRDSLADDWRGENSPVAFFLLSFLNGPGGSEEGVLNSIVPPPYEALEQLGEGQGEPRQDVAAIEDFPFAELR
jgi:hypothetical protein